MGGLEGGVAMFKKYEIIFLPREEPEVSQSLTLLQNTVGGAWCKERGVMRWEWNAHLVFEMQLK